MSLRNPRLEQLKNIANNEGVEINVVKKGSRNETWQLYADDLLDNIFFGNGYDSFNVRDYKNNRNGVHNTFLLVLGEGGLFPFVVFLIFYCVLVMDSIKLFASDPHLSMATFVLITFLMVSHIYFTHHFILFISMWLQYQIKIKGSDEEDIQVH